MGFETTDKDKERKANQLIVIYDELCTKDKHCPAVAVCPEGALTQEGFDPPKVNGTLCTRCGKCVEVCESGAIDMQEIMFDISFD